MTDVDDTEITCTLNGKRWRGRVPTTRTLLELLRTDMGLRGTKRGCEMMSCGVCTVLLDGRPVSACGVFAVDVDAASVRTVEGLQSGEDLNALQQAFADRVAAQCGYCTAGQLMSATALIESHESLSREQIRQWMQTNLCRCGSYTGVIEAIEMVHAQIRSSCDSVADIEL